MHVAYLSCIKTKKDIVIELQGEYFRLLICGWKMLWLLTRQITEGAGKSESRSRQQGSMLSVVGGKLIIERGGVKKTTIEWRLVRVSSCFDSGQG